MTSTIRTAIIFSPHYQNFHIITQAVCHDDLQKKTVMTIQGLKCCRVNTQACGMSEFPSVASWKARGSAAHDPSQTVLAFLGMLV